MKRAIDSPPPRTTLILQEEPASVKTKQKPCQFMNIQPLLVAVTLTYCLIYNLQLRLGPLLSKWLHVLFGHVSYSLTGNMYMAAYLGCG